MIPLGSDKLPILFGEYLPAAKNGDINVACETIMKRSNGVKGNVMMDSPDEQRERLIISIAGYERLHHR